MRISEAAQTMGISSNTLKRLVLAGQIPAYRYGPGKRQDYRFRKEDIDAFLASRLVSRPRS